MTVDARGLQRSLNGFSGKYLAGVAPLIVDGQIGHSVESRVKWVKYYLGYDGEAGQQNAIVNTEFLQRLSHVKDPRYSTPARIARGARRRIDQRAKWARNHRKARQTAGVVQFDGVPVAAWLVPHLKWARDTGLAGQRWHGQLVSGWRDPAYSESLCKRMCGAPSCPGRCAGRSSHHSGSVSPAGAVDVSDYIRFGRIIRRSPHTPAIFNSLPIDPVHFSATGN